MYTASFFHVKNNNKNKNLTNLWWVYPSYHNSEVSKGNECNTDLYLQPLLPLVHLHILNKKDTTHTYTNFKHLGKSWSESFIFIKNSHIKVKTRTLNTFQFNWIESHTHASAHTLCFNPPPPPHPRCESDLKFWRRALTLIWNLKLNDVYEDYAREIATGNDAVRSATTHRQISCTTFMH